MKSCVTTYMYWRATNYMSTCHVFVSLTERQRDRDRQRQTDRERERERQKERPFTVYRFALVA